MKFNVVSLVSIAAWVPLAASQFSCHCQISNNGNAVIAAIRLCDAVGGTICYNSAGNYNVIKKKKVLSNDRDVLFMVEEDRMSDCLYHILWHNDER
ncbi:hypothetical protein Landi51_00358 [Colletotrichum acutatum]